MATRATEDYHAARTFDIYDSAGRLVKIGVSLDEATTTLRLDPVELRWSIDEFAYVSTDEFTVCPHGDRPAAAFTRHAGDDR